MAAAGITSTTARWWCGSSTRATPPRSAGPCCGRGARRPGWRPRIPCRAAARWAAPAPSTLPRPIAHIFRRPLPSRVLSKSVCGFTRLTTMTPSASSAARATKTGTPASVARSRPSPWRRDRHAHRGLGDAVATRAAPPALRPSPRRGCPSPASGRAAPRATSATSTTATDDLGDAVDAAAPHRHARCAGRQVLPPERRLEPRRRFRGRVGERMAGSLASTSIWSGSFIGPPAAAAAATDSRVSCPGAAGRRLPACGTSRCSPAAS